jgi:hypothetical protein
VGDGKYGSREKCAFIGLWAYRLTFPHPVAKNTVSAAALPPQDDAPWSSFSEVLLSLG